MTRTPCFHGGAFFQAIGADFDHLERRHDIINADVLDAWFDPSPKVIEALEEHLPWLIRTSPPTHCDGMIRAIAKARGLPTEAVLPGAGSSDLIFLAFRHWLTHRSRVLIFDPMYSEYAHVLEKVIGCSVDRLRLSRADEYDVNLAQLELYLARAYDLVVLVNPNSPTGRHIPRLLLERVLANVSAATSVWVDETYVEYPGTGESIEEFAVRSSNVVVCKSMSKVYALSGLRAAYLAGPRQIIESLRGITPPWAVSLPAQVAAVAALQDPGYYSELYAETRDLRTGLLKRLTTLVSFDVVPGTANFLLCHLPQDGPEAAVVVSECRKRGLFLRDAGPMGQHLGTRALRIAVKDEPTNRRMLEILTQVLGASNRAGTQCA
jgi:histidinol-phosphate/aromatic aminotransferase/cobyric acid decarboxylase-like protein